MSNSSRQPQTFSPKKSVRAVSFTSEIQMLSMSKTKRNVRCVSVSLTRSATVPNRVVCKYPAVFRRHSQLRLLPLSCHFRILHLRSCLRNKTVATERRVGRNRTRILRLTDFPLNSPTTNCDVKTKKKKNWSRYWKFQRRRRKREETTTTTFIRDCVNRWAHRWTTDGGRGEKRV